MGNTMNDRDNEFWGEPISTYTRADAIEDGDLIAVDEAMQKEAGFKFPIAIASEVWDEYVDWSEEDSERQTYQDVLGRLWDVLHMLRVAISRAASKSGNKLRFSLYVVPRRVDSRAKKTRLVHLWANFHPGDNLEPVITIQKNEFDD